MTIFRMTKKVIDMKFKLFLIAIFVLAFFLRFYQLGVVPNGLYQDETAIGYNAYSLIQTGKDEYGKTFPLYFKSFGDWKLPVYIYSTILPIQVFGLDAYAVRFPSAFFGFLTVIIFYFFVADLTKNRKLAIIATGLLAINPWSLHYNRATFEVSIGLFFFILGGYLLNKFFQKHTPATFLGGVLCFIVVLYSYNLTRLLAPLLLVLFLFYNRRLLKAAPKKEILFGSIVAAGLLIPFVMTLFGQGGVSSAGGTLLFSSAVVQAPHHELRWFANMLPDPMSSLFFNKYLLMGWQYVTNIAAYFSVPFFFLTGSPHGNHGIGNVGLLYLFELPLVIAGVIFLIKKRIHGTYLLFGWAIAVILVAALTRDVPHATRSFFLVISLEVFSAAGILALNQLSIKYQVSSIKYTFFKLFAICYILFAVYNIVYYFTSYYVRFPVVYARAWNADDRDVALYLKEEEHKYDKIIFDSKAGFVYSSVLFYTAYHPESFQQSVVRAPDDDEGFSKVVSFGKYEFREIDWAQDPHKERTLIVTRNDYKPDGINAFKVFYFPERYAAFAVGQQVMEYPVHDLSYVLVKKQ